MESIEFVRRLDGLVHRFDPDGIFNGRPSYRRRGLDLWWRWPPDRGWCVVDADGVPNSGPLPAGSRHREHPPTGPWRSRKAGRSSLNGLRRVDGEPPR
ncbi:hypothetical protein [Kitasatospora sp. NPDC001095]